MKLLTMLQIRAAAASVMPIASVMVMMVSFARVMESYVRSWLK